MKKRNHLFAILILAFVLYLDTFIINESLINVNAMLNTNNSYNSSNSSNTSNTNNKYKNSNTSKPGYNNVPMSVPIKEDFRKNLLENGVKTGQALKMELIGQTDTLNFNLQNGNGNNLKISYILQSHGKDKNIRVIIFPEKINSLKNKEVKELVLKGLTIISDKYSMDENKLKNELDVVIKDLLSKEEPNSNLENKEIKINIKGSMYQEIPVIELRFTENKNIDFSHEELRNNLIDNFGNPSEEETVLSFDTKEKKKDADGNEVEGKEGKYILEYLEDRDEDNLGITWELYFKNTETPVDELGKVIKEMPKELSLDAKTILKSVESVYDGTFIEEEKKVEENTESTKSTENEDNEVEYEDNEVENEENEVENEEEKNYIDLKNGNGIIRVFNQDEKMNHKVEIKYIQSQEKGTYQKPY